MDFIFNYTDFVISHPLIFAPLVPIVLITTLVLEARDTNKEHIIQSKRTADAGRRMAEKVRQDQETYLRNIRTVKYK